MNANTINKLVKIYVSIMIMKKMISNIIYTCTKNSMLQRKQVANSINLITFFFLYQTVMIVLVSPLNYYRIFMLLLSATSSNVLRFDLGNFHYECWIRNMVQIFRLIGL